MESVPSYLLGPLAALALALAGLGLFYTGKILSSRTVSREDYERVMEINASYAEGFKTQTTALHELVTIIKYQQRNGGKE